MQKNSILNPNNDKISIIDKYNTLISTTRGMLFSGLLGYEQLGNLFYNRVYFNAGQEITEEYIQTQVKNGDQIIKDLNAIVQQVEGETLLNNIQKQLIKDLIQKSIHLLQYHQHAIYIEAEKAGYKLSYEEKRFHRQEVIKIEDILYGKDITQLEDRKNRVIDKLHELYIENNQELNEEEQKIWQENILKIFPASVSIEKKDIKEQKKDIYISENHIFDLVSLLLEIEGFKKEDMIRIQMDITRTDPYFDKEKEIYHIPAARKDKEIYDYFKSLGIGQKFKIIKKLLGNNSVTISKENNMFKKNQISLSAPEKDGKYNVTKKILPIIYDHEISTHVNTGMGNFKNIYIKDPERGDLEEGVALFNQTMAEGKNLNELYEASIGDIRMFLGEYFDEQKLKQLFEIYFKLTKEKNPKIGDTIRRTKIGVPVGEKGAKRKDLTYGNSKEIIKELEQFTKTPEGIDLLNNYAKAIYSTNLGYKSLQNINEILNGIKSLDELEPNFPIFAGKIIYWKLFKGKLDKDKMLENDLRRFIHTDKNVTDKQKRLLVKILQLIKKYGEEQPE